VVVHVKKPDLTCDEEALRLLGRQNTGLATGDWIVTRESVSRDATSTHFVCLIEDQSLDSLESSNFRPCCNLGRASVRLLERECGRKSESVEGTTEGTA